MSVECRDWQDVISAAHDGEAVEPDEVATALAHCASCAECGAFRDALARLDATRAPLAPEGLTQRVMSAVDAAAMSAASTLERESVPAKPIVEQPSWVPLWLTRRRLWTATALTAAAALVVGITVVSMRPTTTSTGTAGVAAQKATAPAAPSTTERLSADLSASTAGSTVATAGALISYSSRVYRAGTMIDTATVALANIGATTSSLDRAGTPSMLPVYRSPTADGSVLVGTPAGVRQFKPVLRQLASRQYQLVTGADLTQYGQWPTLPTRYPQPTKADGSPTFHPSGTDPLGVSVYAVAGTETGFAVAPGTAPTDPAGGNPNWTWWEPLLIP